ncbi:hypothetical protein [Mycoplasma sp. CSL7503-lung]|uniref:hypothetical protein n=1 Tax=Mycoplasma sp. CSL7503-lung TaxID=536372 RepID=UPI0021D00456|nr:hypothetical protein [Mycoplasma sp. CSL7503-lung]MCU4706838.1 hypothetical protein [Mycoplasma sp. CSL7503-lung]
MKKKYKYLILSSIVVGSLITATIPISWTNKKQIKFNSNNNSKTTLKKDKFNIEIKKLENKAIDIEKINSKIESLKNENNINYEELEKNEQKEVESDQKIKNTLKVELNNNKLLNSFKNIENLIKNKIYLNNDIYKISINYIDINEVENKNIINEINQELKGLLKIFNLDLIHSINQLSDIEITNKELYIETYRSI